MTTTLTLYDATAALRTVDEWIVEHADEVLANGGALTPELEALLDQAEGDFAAKVERVALKVREFEASAAAVKAEADRLAQRARVADNAAKSLKAYLKRHLEAAGQTKVAGALATVRIQNNPPALRGELSQEALAALFQSDEPAADCVELIPQSYRLDSRAALAHHKAGGALPAGLTVEQGTHLRIA